MISNSTPGLRVLILRRPIFELNPPSATETANKTFIAYTSVTFTQFGNL